MTDDDRGWFGEQLALLGEVFNEPVSALRAAAYWDALHDLPARAVRAAMHDLVGSARFFPKPVEIREPATQRMREAQLLLAAPTRIANAITDAAYTAQDEARERRVEAAKRAEYFSKPPFTSAERWAFWRAQDEALRGYHIRMRPRTPATASDDLTVQRCPKCHSFQIIPDIGGAIWRCARCRTLCVD
jgi:hypothetical protein